MHRDVYDNDIAAAGTLTREPEDEEASEFLRKAGRVTAATLIGV
jgi:hypothetical protein